MSYKRIVIVASERSGTNLLRVLLGKHKEISAPVAVHFFNTFRPSIKAYGDLSVKNNAALLVNHFLRSANHVYTDWNLHINVNETITKYNIESFPTAFDAIHRAYAENEDKLHYVVKDNDMFEHFDLMTKLHDDGETFYIHLYRDPRDHIVSWLQTPLFLHTPYDIAIKWRDEQKKIRETKHTVKMFNVSYESLIQNTQEVITSLLNYLNIIVDPNCFTTDKGNKESKRNELWRNLSKPVLKDNKNNYHGVLSKKDLRIVETICKTEMSELGYTFDTDANWKDYFSVYEKNTLPKRRIQSMRKNKEFFNKKMKDLQSKLDLLTELKAEVNAKKNS